MVYLITNLQSNENIFNLLVLLKMYYIESSMYEYHCLRMIINAEKEIESAPVHVSIVIN